MTLSSSRFYFFLVYLGVNRLWFWVVLCTIMSGTFIKNSDQRSLFVVVHHSLHLSHVLAHFEFFSFIKKLGKIR